jgi:hypothetical protein
MGFLKKPFEGTMETVDLNQREALKFGVKKTDKFVYVGPEGTVWGAGPTELKCLADTRKCATEAGTPQPEGVVMLLASPVGWEE